MSSKYELTIKIAQIQHLTEEKKYKKAAEVLGTIDVAQVRSRADLHTFAEIYMKTEQFEAAKAIYLKLYKRNRTRRILNRLIFLAIRTNHIDEAESFYEEFLKMSTSPRDNLILRYRIDKAKGAPVGQLIDILEHLKEEEYIEEWAYELAKLYQKAGRNAECRQECEDILLWFGQGEIVERAKHLIAYLEDKNVLSYYDDSDFTMDDMNIQEEEYQQEEEEEIEEKEEGKAQEEIKKEEAQKTLQKMQESQSGTGITKDLAKEISAIFEAENGGGLKEKAVNVMEEASNIAVNVVDRMAHAMQKKAEKNYIPLPIGQEPPNGMEEISRGEGAAEEIASRPEPGNREGGEVTMIDLDKIMPEPDMQERRQAVPEDSPEVAPPASLDEKDLPTTKALHRSFENMLTLIAGEREPKNFVLIGDGEERILGVTKQIVRLVHKKNFLSTTKIARIQAEQLNRLDLLGVAGQIKGGCLLVDGASALLFPTITKIFALMDEFKGDFMVVLADEGNILDELFRVAPTLARRFEYVIDISQYTEEDYGDR